MSYGLFNLARHLSRRPFSGDPFFSSPLRELRPRPNAYTRGAESKQVEKSNPRHDNSSNTPTRWSNHRSRGLDLFRDLDPWTAATLDELFPVSRLERDLWRGVEPLMNIERNVMPETEVQETDKAFVVTMDIPGVRKEDVKVKIGGRDNRTLYVTAERRELEANDDSETPTASNSANATQDSASNNAKQKVTKAPENESSAAQDKQQQSNEVQVQDKEAAQTRVVRRSSYKFSQTLELPENVDLKGISAKHEHGQLLITIPKMEHVQEVEQHIPIA